MYYILGFIFLVILFSVFLLLKFSRGRKLNLKTKNHLKNNFVKITKLSSNKEKIVDFDKLYHKILLELRYKGTFGEILKSKPRIIANIDSVWRLHKLRNKLVHDFDEIGEGFLNTKSLEYKKIVGEFLDRV